MKKNALEPVTSDKMVQVRYLLPENVHKKIVSHQRKLAAAADRDVTQEEAVVNLLSSIEPPENISLEQ